MRFLHVRETKYRRIEHRCFCDKMQNADARVNFCKAFAVEIRKSVLLKKVSTTARAK